MRPGAQKQRNSLNEFSSDFSFIGMLLTQCVGIGTICEGTEFQYNSPPGSEGCKQWKIPKPPEDAATVIEIDSEKSEGMVEFPGKLMD